MEDIVSFCDKTNTKTNTKIDQIEYIFKQQLEKIEYDEIQKTIKSNVASTKKILYQPKLKKFNNLKQNSKETTFKKNENTEKPTYAEILRKSHSPSRNRNITTNLSSNSKPNIIQ